MMKYLLLMSMLFHIDGHNTDKKSIDISTWTYIEVDNCRGKWSDFGETPLFLRYFGLVLEDVNHDGLPDIISGRYWYKNPGGDLTAKWDRHEFPVNVDACLVLDVDGDDCIDIIGMALPKVYWLEAKDRNAAGWDTIMIGEIPRERHRNGQGFKVADIWPGGRDEVLIASEGGIYCFEVPADPVNDPWEVIRIASTESAEGFDVFDIDNDGFPDLVAGDLDDEQKAKWLKVKKGNKGEPRILKWYINPGKRTPDWEYRVIGETIHAIDRIRVANLNMNQVPDIVCTEERFPGLEPDAHLLWFNGIRNGEDIRWERNIIIQQYSMNNLDVADINNDGYPDIVTAEHKGEALKTQVFRNNGQGQFIPILVDKGKESHLGTQVKDMDNDGDLDIVSIAWDSYEYVHLWRNDGIRCAGKDTEKR